MKLTGARILMECLREQKVDTIFGYPGGTILNVYDALYDCKEITHILTSHEQGAAHAADGYARSTGKVGVCFATSGPGATNLTTGIATAYMDSSSVVFISCNVPQNLIGRDAFQEVDITGITMPITKSTYLVRDVTKLADTVREAFALARSGRPGPVVIDITRDVTSAECDYEPLPLEQHAASGHLASLIRRAYTSSLKMPEADLDDVEKLVEMIAESEKPMLICGGGVVRSRAHEEFRQFVRRIDAPVAITVMGGGGVSGRDVMTTGMIGMHGSVASNMACDNCDLLIAVGCRFSDRVALKPETFAHQAKIVHIDIDRAEINKNVQTDHHIIGDAKQVLNLLLERLPQYEHKEWKDFVLSFPRETEYGESESVLTPKQVLSAIARKCPQDSIVATDVGQHQMWAIQHLHFDYPGQLLTSGGFGTMGFGLGAAIGAKQGNPDKTVIHITGDGCFRMNGNELATEAYYGLPVITVIFNNRNLGMVRQWQSLIYDHRYSQTSLENRSPDFVKFADAFGLKGRRVTQPSELEEAITEALAESAQGRGYVIDCAINADDFYGAEAFRLAYDHLTHLKDEGDVAMVGYLLKNTLSENGYVSRGVCEMDETGRLTALTERTHIITSADGPLMTEDLHTYTRLEPDTVVSMNMWAFPHSMMAALEKGFPVFLREQLSKNPEKAEYYLPMAVDAEMQAGRAGVSVKTTHDKWYGVTNPEDKQDVVDAVARMAEAGLYPAPLWPEA